MGYANTYPYGFIEVSTGSKGNLDAYVSGGYTSQSINLIAIPSYIPAPDYAYLDVIIQWINDTSGAANYFVPDSKIQLNDSGGTPRDAGNISNTACYIEANATAHTYYVIPGTTNIAGYITPGASQMVIIYGKSHGDSLNLRGCSGRLRLYFNAR